MDTQIYIHADGRQEGPFAIAEINQRISQGSVAPASTLAWYQGCPGWMPLLNIPGVSALPMSTPPPLPTSPPLPPPLTVAANAEPPVISSASASFEFQFEPGAKLLRQMARRFLVIGIINTIAGIIITAVGWPGGLFSVFVGVVELVNAPRFWSTPPKRKRAPMYVAVLEIINVVISLGSLWSLIGGISNVSVLKRPETKAYFAALNRGEVPPPGTGQAPSTGPALPPIVEGYRERPGR